VACLLGCLVKPSSLKEITLSPERALKYREEKQDKPAPVALNLEGAVGSCRAMRMVFDKVALASASDANVLVSRIIHSNGLRAIENFVVVDCAALTESLVEGTPFGHRLKTVEIAIPPCGSASTTCGP